MAVLRERFDVCKREKEECEKEVWERVRGEEEKKEEMNTIATITSLLEENVTRRRGNVA